MIENVRGILDAVFDDYRKRIKRQLKKLGYQVDWQQLNASDFGVPQLRPPVVFVAINKNDADRFEWPTPHKTKAPTAGGALHELMAANGWKGAKLLKAKREWKSRGERPHDSRRCAGQGFCRNAPAYGVDGGPYPGLSA